MRVLCCIISCSYFPQEKGVKLKEVKQRETEISVMQRGLERQRNGVSVPRVLPSIQCATHILKKQINKI